MNSRAIQIELTKDFKQSVSETQYFKLVAGRPPEVATKLNMYASKHVSVRQVIPCSELSEDDVRNLALRLRPYVDGRMKESFPEDDGRQVHLNPWLSHAGWSRARRNALCAETMKLWAHHIPDKGALQGVTLPELPSPEEFDKVSEEFLQYNRSVTCVSGHSVVDFDERTASEDYDYDWPRWPRKAHFIGNSHGPYPFWQFGGKTPRNGAESWIVNMSFATPGLYTDVGALEVWHSTPLMRTKIYHGACRWDFLGYKALKTRPCAALQINTFSPSGKFYLYTVDDNDPLKRADNTFCCESSFGLNRGITLGTINRRFTDYLKYIGNYTFAGDFYRGPAKRFVATLSAGPNNDPWLPLNVWYETTMDGRPLRFGEVGRSLYTTMDGYLHDSDLPLIYEEFDPTYFDNPESMKFDDAVLDLPQACRTRLFSCLPKRENRHTGAALNHSNFSASIPPH